MQLSYIFLFATFVLADLSLAAPSPVSSNNTLFKPLSVHETLKCRNADCPSGSSRKGDLCYFPFHSYTTWSKVANCPSGYTNMGLTCYRGPHSYTKCCTTIWSKCRCRSGYTNMGCHCQRWASSLTSGYMSCSSGYFLNKETGRCYQTCKSGYTSYGEYCKKPSVSKGNYIMTCNDGEWKAADKCCPPACKKLDANCEGLP